MDMKQQTADSLKDAAAISVGAVGTGASWGLSEVAVIVSIMTGLATFAFMLSMVWLNIKKAKRIDRSTVDASGDTRPPAL